MKKKKKKKEEELTIEKANCCVKHESEVKATNIHDHIHIQRKNTEETISHWQAWQAVEGWWEYT